MKFWPATSVAEFVCFGAESNQMFLFEPLKLMQSHFSPHYLLTPLSAHPMHHFNRRNRCVFNRHPPRIILLHGWHFSAVWKWYFLKAKPVWKALCWQIWGGDRYDFESKQPLFAKRAEMNYSCEGGLPPFLPHTSSVLDISLTTEQSR